MNKNTLDPRYRVDIDPKYAKITLIQYSLYALISLILLSFAASRYVIERNETCFVGKDLDQMINTTTRIDYS